MNQPNTTQGGTFSLVPEHVDLGILDKTWDATVTREDLERGESYVLHRLMSPRECRRLIAAAEARGFERAGLAIGDDSYRVNLRARNNLRLILDDPKLATALFARLQSVVDPRHEDALILGLNWRFRIYKYEPGHCFAPHYDLRTKLPGGETRFSLVIYLNEGFEGGSTRFFEKKDRASRRGKGRGRKLDNKVKYEARPPTGAAVVFDHLLLHEGSTVTEGVKYAVRSDLLYAPR